MIAARTSRPVASSFMRWSLSMAHYTQRMRRVFAALLFAWMANAGAFPDKPIRFVVGFTPGGPSDILARVLGQKLAEQLGAQVVIDNRPGAGGIIAADAVARSAPDGHTWLLGNNSILATNQ